MWKVEPLLGTRTASLTRALPTLVMCRRAVERNQSTRREKRKPGRKELKASESEKERELDRGRD